MCIGIMALIITIEHIPNSDSNADTSNMDE